MHPTLLHPWGRVLPAGIYLCLILSKVTRLTIISCQGAGGEGEGLWLFSGCCIQDLLYLNMHLWNKMDNKPHAYYNFWPLHIPLIPRPPLNPPNLGLPSTDNLRNLKATPTQHFFLIVIVCIPRPFSSKGKALLLLIEDIPALKLLSIQGDVRKKVGSLNQNQTKCLLTRLFSFQRRRSIWHFLLCAAWAGVIIMENTKARFCEPLNPRKVNCVYPIQVGLLTKQASWFGCQGD